MLKLQFINLTKDEKIKLLLEYQQQKAQNTALVNTSKSSYSAKITDVPDVIEIHKDTSKVYRMHITESTDKLTKYPLYQIKIL